MARRKRRAKPLGLVARMISGLDARQIAILLGAVIGSGGLVKLDAARNTQAADDRTTATASLSVSVAEQVEDLRDRVYELERRLRRTGGQRRSSAPPPAVVESDSATAPPPEPEISGGQDAEDPGVDAAGAHRRLWAGREAEGRPEQQ